MADKWCVVCGCLRLGTKNPLPESKIQTIILEIVPLFLKLFWKSHYPKRYQLPLILFPDLSDDTILWIHICVGDRTVEVSQCLDKKKW